MTEPPYRSRVDERVIGAGTAIRFALLVILLLVSSASMILDVMTWLSSENDKDGLGCVFAAGADPLHSSNFTVHALISEQNAAFEACLARYDALPPLLASLAWPALVLSVAVALFRALPAWKTRRRRVVRLAVVDLDGAIARELVDLTTMAGLDCLPRFVVDPAARSGGAVVFGSNRRPTICLHGGLLVRRVKDPSSFRTVVLHELAHVRNGDVTVTYLTVAVWRVFLTLALLPYTVWTAVAFVNGPGKLNWAITAPNLTRNVLLTVLLVALIYLARSDVLRSREIYADLAAVRWGADCDEWSAPTPPPARGPVRRAISSCIDVWRTHPRWDLRRASLRDPAVLFGVQVLPMFLTGAAATLVESQASAYAANYLRDITWSNEVIAACVAVLVTSVAGTTLWRAAAHSVLTGQPAPSGARAGLWLGMGMAAGELVMPDHALNHWLPAQPQVLLVVIATGAAYGWWTTQCAQLWLRAWPGSTIRPAILIGLVTGCLVLTAWFGWWAISGSMYADGLSDLLTINGVKGDMTAALLVGLSDLAGGLLTLPAVATLWIMPLLVWTFGKTSPLPRWVRVVQQQTGDVLAPVSRLPPLSRTMWAALLGGAFSWIALAVVMVNRHTIQPPGEFGVTALATETFIVWVLVAWVAGMTLAAAVASPPAGRYGLVAALIASQTAGLVAFVGMFALAALDGCLPPLATLRGSCAWRSDKTWAFFSYLGPPAFLIAAVAAVVVAAIASTVRRLRGSAVMTLPPPTPGGWIARRISAAAVCALFVGFATACQVTLAVYDAMASTAVSSSSIATVDAPPSAQTRRFQVAAWASHGGADLLAGFLTVEKDYVTLLKKSKGEVDSASARPFCARFDQIADDADTYFHVPDAQAQALWREFIEQTRTIGQDCGWALEKSDGDLLVKVLNEIAAAIATADSVTVRISDVANAGGG